MVKQYEKCNANKLLGRRNIYVCFKGFAYLVQVIEIIESTTNVRNAFAFATGEFLVECQMSLSFFVALVFFGQI